MSYDLMFGIVTVTVLAAAVRAWWGAGPSSSSSSSSELYTYVGQDAQVGPIALHPWPAAASPDERLRRRLLDGRAERVAALVAASIVSCRYCGGEVPGAKCASCGAPRGRSGGG